MPQEITVRSGDAYVGVKTELPDLGLKVRITNLVKTSDGHSVRTYDSKYVRASNAR